MIKKKARINMRLLSIITKIINPKPTQIVPHRWAKKDNVEKPNILVNEVKLKINGIPQQKKCVRQLNSKKYEDKNLIISYY